MEDKYFAIYFGEDGISVSETTEKEILEIAKEVSENYSTTATPFVDSIPKGGWSTDGDYPIYTHLFIKGKIVVPQPVTKVTEFKI